MAHKATGTRSPQITDGKPLNISQSKGRCVQVLVERCGHSSPSCLPHQQASGSVLNCQKRSGLVLRPVVLESSAREDFKCQKNVFRC